MGAELTIECEARMPEAVLDDAMIESMRARVGLELRIEHSTNNRDVTRLAIEKFAAGIGDTNPLWTDEAYARASVHGDPVAPARRSVSARCANTRRSRSRTSRCRRAGGSGPSPCPCSPRGR